MTDDTAAMHQMELADGKSARAKLLVTSVVIVLVLAIGAVWFVLHGGAPASAVAAPAAPVVTVSKPIEMTVASTTGFLGQFSAVDNVEIRAQVGGYLTEIHFSDGQLVRKGDLLFVIDPRPYQSQLDQAQAQLQTAIAQLELANKQFTRASDLAKSGFGSIEVLDQRVQQQRSAQAVLDQAKASLHVAQLNMEFTRITAPFSGRVSSRKVSVGSLVNGGINAATTLLTTLVSVNPVYLDFDMSENDFRAYQRFLKAHPAGEANRSVDVSVDDANDWSHRGTLDFLDNEVDRSSGTLRARATISNPDLSMTPGQFARLRVPTASPSAVLLVPPETIIADQSNEMVMTVSADGTVVAKKVETGPISGGLRVIRRGLAASDSVIINGLVRARPGAKVDPRPGTIQTGNQS